MSEGSLRVSVAVVTATVVFGASAPTHAQDTITYYPLVVTDQKQSLIAGDQYYDMSTSGFRTYLTHLQRTRPSLCRALELDVAELESNHRLANLLLWGLGIGAGSGLMVLALAVVAARGDCDRHGSDSRAFERCEDETLPAGLLVLGGAVMAGGVVGAWAVRPGRDEMMSVVNKHNRLRGDLPPLRLQVGATGSHRYAQFRLNLNF